jgi:integrase/recombinase XerD
MAVAVPPPAAARPFDHLVLDFLAYLELERGLSRNTLDAYRSASGSPSTTSRRRR